MELMQFLKSEYGYDTPILLSELDLQNLTEENCRKALSRLTKKEYLKRFSQGIYYIPTKTPFGISKLSAKKVYEKKYIKNNSSIYGFYSGLIFGNILGITTQMSNTIEIVTNNESSRLREVQIGNQKVRLRRPNVEITTLNVKILQLLDFINRYPVDKFNKEHYDIILKYVKEQKIKKSDLYTYIDFYPSKVAKILIKGGIIDGFI